jgi:hypothetical protein
MLHILDSNLNRRSCHFIVPREHILQSVMPSPREKLIEFLQSLCTEYGLTWDDQLSNDVPRKWRVHSDMLLLPSSRCFLDPRWASHIRELFGWMYFIVYR